MTFPYLSTHPNLSVYNLTVQQHYQTISLQLKSDLFPVIPTCPQQHLGDNCLFFISSEKNLKYCKGMSL